MPDRKFNIAISLVDKSGDVIRVEGCNTVMFTNVGDTTARVNGMVVFPAAAPLTLGDSRSFGGHQNELYMGIIRVSFALPLGVAPLLEIVQIFYTDKG